MSANESNTQTQRQQLPQVFSGISARGWILLGILTLFSTALCITGLGYGLPHDSRPDEIPNIQVALTVLKDLVGQGQNGLNPKAFNYGSLYYYLLTLCYWAYFSIGQLFPDLIRPAHWFDFNGFIFAYQTDATPFHLIIRAVSALGAILLTPALFLSARQWTITNKADNTELTASAFPWIAAGLMATNYLVIRNAHFGSPDTLMTLGILISLMMIWWYQKDPHDTKRLQWAGIAIGLASSIKIPAVLMLVPLAWACLSPHWHTAGNKIEWKPAGIMILKGLGWTALAFAVTSPWMILDIPGVIHWFSYEGAFYGFTLPGLPVGWQFYPTYALPIGLGFLTYALSIAGVIIIIKETIHSKTSDLKRAQNVTLLLSLGIFILYLGPNLRIMTRYALPLIPFLLILASHTAGWLSSHVFKLLPQAFQATKKSGIAIAVLIVLFLVIEPLTYSLQWDHLLAKGDTRQIAADWIINHIPEKTAIAVGPRLGGIRLPLSYGQLLLETGPNNMTPPTRPSMENVTPQVKLINTYDANILRQLGIRYVILYGGNLLFSSPSWEMQRYFEGYRLKPIVHISPNKPNTQNLISRTPAASHDPLDALFTPFVGFTDSAFTGPEIFIFDIAQLDDSSIKNPGNLR